MQSFDWNAGFRSALDSAAAAMAGNLPAIAAAECIHAASHAWSRYRETADHESAEYRQAWEAMVLALRHLPPTVLRRVVKMIDERSP